MDRRNALKSLAALPFGTLIPFGKASADTVEVTPGKKYLVFIDHASPMHVFDAINKAGMGLGLEGYIIPIEPIDGSIQNAVAIYELSSKETK